jgi:hypothetical protein
MTVLDAYAVLAFLTGEVAAEVEPLIEEGGVLAALGLAEVIDKWFVVSACRKKTPVSMWRRLDWTVPFPLTLGLPLRQVDDVPATTTVHVIRRRCRRREGSSR